MSKKTNILILTLCFLLISACGNHTVDNIDTDNDDTEEITNIEYAIPDEFFNTSFSQDEEGNIYFHLGRYIYYLDSNYESHIFYDCWYEDNYYLVNCKYYDGYIYSFAFNYDKNNSNYGWNLVRINVDSQKFEWLCFVERPTSFEYISIYDNSLYLIADDKMRVYSLDDFSNYEDIYYTYYDDRNDFYNGVYSDLLTAINIRHVYQDSLYSVDYHDHDEQSYIIEYNMLTNEDIYHPINDNEIKLDLLDETWMTSYVEDNIGYVVLYNLDFSERSVVLEVEIKDGDVINWADI